MQAIATATSGASCTADGSSPLAAGIALDDLAAPNAADPLDGDGVQELVGRALGPHRSEFQPITWDASR